jgi:hypothetical protein
LINGAFRAETKGLYKVAYLVILALMAVALVILVIPGFDQRVFVLEAVEIGLFGAFWIIQTVQFRNAEPTADIRSAETAPSTDNPSQAVVPT